MKLIAFLGLLVCSLLFSATPALAQDNCEGETVDGVQTGHWKCFYEDGTLQQEGNYEAGQKQGEWKLYHSNGQLALKGPYKDGVETGTWIVYDETGTQIDSINYGP